MPKAGCKAALASSPADVVLACAALTQAACTADPDCHYFSGCGFSNGRPEPETCTTVGRALDSPILSYTVTYGSPTVSHVVLASAGRSFKASTLSANTKYTFTVSATTVAGTGVASEPLALWTPAKPAKPQAPLVATKVTSSTVTLVYKIAQDSVAALTSASPITSYKLYAQSQDTKKTCNPISDTATAQVAAKCAFLTCPTDTPCAACTAVDVGLGTTSAADCQWTTAWIPAARSVTHDGEAVRTTTISDPADVAYQDRGKSSRAINAANNAWPWLEIVQRTGDAGGLSGTVQVTELMPARAYRFKIAFTNAAGDSPASDSSATFTTLEREITNLRIYSGPPCIYKSPSTAKTTFAASAKGTNVKYRWELLHKSGSGWAALNQDGTAGANNFNAGMNRDGSPLHSGRTTHVDSGSTIAGPGTASQNNCLSDDCSVMEYLLPLPGSDKAVANYDEIAIRVVAYNTRGIVRESVTFGWTKQRSNDYQTIERCGCTDPTDDSYWDLATFHIPTDCAGTEDWEAGTNVYELNTVLAGEYDYYQFPIEQSAYDVQVSLRVDAGAVDVFVSTGGVADPNLDSTHIKQLKQEAVTGYTVINLDYDNLGGATSVYITVRGSSGVSDSRACPEANCAAFSFGRYKVLAQATNFRSFICDASDTQVGIDCSDTTVAKVSRSLLSNSVAQTKVIPSHYYHFYEYYYPKADNDLDVEVKVSINKGVTPTGAVTMYASKTERYPGPQRATSTYAGYWTQPSTVTNAHTGTATADTPTTLVYTMQPHDHTDPTDNVLYLSVFGAAAHAQGTPLPRTSYSIVAKVYRYRVESDKLQSIAGSVELTEERRYSVVTLDNFNYYEVPLTKKTRGLRISITLHYGSVTLYRSKSKLPTQDKAEGADWSQDLGTPSTTATVFVVDSSAMNLAGGYLYLGIIGRVADSSYSIKVSLVEYGSIAELYYCPQLMPATNVGSNEACTATITSIPADSFYRFYVGTRDKQMSVPQRSGAGTKPSGSPPTGSPDTWGTDWTETSKVTWTDSFSDEWDLDVDVTIKVRAPAPSPTYQVYTSTSENYPSQQRGYCLNGRFAADSSSCATEGSKWSTVVGTPSADATIRVNTFQDRWVYLSVAGTDTNDGCFATQWDATPAVKAACAALTGSAACTAAGDPDCTWGKAPVDMPGGCGAKKTADQATCNPITAKGTCDGNDKCLWSALHVSFANGEVQPPAVSADTVSTATCTNNCNNRGACVLDGTAALCMCNTGFFGAACESATSAQISNAQVTVSVPGCSFGAGAPSCIVPERPLGASALEYVTLDCSIENCKPRGIAGKSGYVTCETNGVTCKQLAPAPMMTVDITVSHPPPYSRIRAYMDGLPYPRSGANTFLVGKSPTETPAASSAVQKLKVYTLVPRAKHTLVTVLTTDFGEPIETTTRQFSVSYISGCGKDASGIECSGNGVCHNGYCVCFDGKYGADCSNSIDEAATPSSSPLAAGFLGTDGTGMQSFRTRRNAMVMDKIGEARFVNSQHLAGTTSEIQRSNTHLKSIRASVNQVMQADITGTNSKLNQRIKQENSATAASVEKLRTKAERNTVLLQQAKLESARLTTSNLEAYLDHKRALFSHQTAVQNRHAADKVRVDQLTKTKKASIDAAFKTGRFIKNQLRTANGPRTPINKLKTSDCSNDQFFHVDCESNNLAAGTFKTSDTTYDTIPR
jgi:hypothetical protein